MAKTKAKSDPHHVTAEQLALGMATILDSPRDVGRLELIVARPDQGERKVLKRAKLTPEGGVPGDRWLTSSWKKWPDGTSDNAVQVTLMNARCIRAIAGEPENWATAGDNLFVDLDLSREHLPPGTRLRIGKCVLEITKVPHNGCWKFKGRFGPAALKFVNSPQGKALRWRGVHARIVEGGEIAVGDQIERLEGNA